MYGSYLFGQDNGRDFQKRSRYNAFDSIWAMLLFKYDVYIDIDIVLFWDLKWLEATVLSYQMEGDSIGSYHVKRNLNDRLRNNNKIISFLLH